LFGRPSPQQTDEFEAVALTQLDALVRSATRLCESREEAEDAVQETYLQAWKYWRSFEPGTNCRAWLFRILFNVIHKRAVKAAALIPIEEHKVNERLQLDPQTSFNKLEVLEVFDQLSTEHREVILLIGVEEMSYKDAANVLEVPMGTVMSRLNRARTQLRQRLGYGHLRSCVKDQ
jgi:RNA polymerase sigma-70 factor (ECF subfamily)